MNSGLVKNQMYWFHADLRLFSTFLVYLMMMIETPLILRFPSRKRPIIFDVFIATCSADSEFSGGTDKYKTPVILSSSGRCSWFCPASFTSTCPIDVQYFPFDRQKCVLKFGSWTYEVNNRLNRPFPSCLSSLFQKKSKPLQNHSCGNVLHLQVYFHEIKLIFIWMVLYEDSFWIRGTRYLAGGLSEMANHNQDKDITPIIICVSKVYRKSDLYI